MPVKAVSLGAFLYVGTLAACAVDATGDDVATTEDDIKAAKTCGGLANLPCPSGYQCVDNPNDNCDPKKGGADCGGICKKAKKPKCAHAAADYIALGKQCQVVKYFCVQGKTPFVDSCGCGCAATTCAAKACGPALGMPNKLCSDGVTVSGPTGKCLKNADGTCGWEIVGCP